MDISESHKEGNILRQLCEHDKIVKKNILYTYFLLADHKECTQLLQITQDCLELGGSAGDLMLPVCTLYRVCRTCVSII